MELDTIAPGRFKDSQAALPAIGHAERPAGPASQRQGPVELAGAFAFPAERSDGRPITSQADNLELIGVHNTHCRAVDQRDPDTPAQRHLDGREAFGWDEVKGAWFGLGCGARRRGEGHGTEKDRP